jgi:hypothetical protein
MLCSALPTLDLLSGTRCFAYASFHAYTDVPLNDANYDYRVNVLEYWETKKDGRKQHVSWVTTLSLTSDNVYDVMRAGRARWKIENETFK